MNSHNSLNALTNHVSSDISDNIFSKAGDFHIFG